MYVCIPSLLSHDTSTQNEILGISQRPDPAAIEDSRLASIVNLNVFAAHPLAANDSRWKPYALPSYTHSPPTTPAMAEGRRALSASLDDECLTSPFCLA